MSTLTDEEKVAALTGEDVTKTPPPAETTADSDNAEHSTSEDIEANADIEAGTDNSQATSLTKPYAWLKGETPEEWVDELKKAYDNSTSQAIVLKKQLDDNKITVEEAKRLIAQGRVATESQTQAQTTDIDIDAKIASHPAVAGAQALIEQQMVSAFNDFSEKFPQAREQDGMDKIIKAAPGVSQTYAALNGRQPTYAELYEGIADLLRWQPAADRGRRDQSLKEVVSGTAAAGPTSSRSQKTKITESQLKVARRLFPTISDEDLIKDLEKYV